MNCRSDQVYEQIKILEKNINLYYKKYNQPNPMNKIFWDQLIEKYKELRVNGWISDNSYKAKSIASSLLYLRCLQDNIDITQRDLAEIADINENTVRKVSNKMPIYVLNYTSDL